VPTSTPSRCVPDAPLLDPATRQDRLEHVPDWTLTENGAALTRTFPFGNYHETMAFVNAIAWIAHAQDHHPDLGVHFNRVHVRWSSHDAGGVTDNDVVCAARTDSLLDNAR
jgi:4a-hydroxytetrahydrobiopterin dehydratase